MHAGSLKSPLVAGVSRENDRHRPDPLAVRVLIVRRRVGYAAKTVGVHLSEPSKSIPSEVVPRVAHGVSRHSKPPRVELGVRERDRGDDGIGSSEQISSITKIQARWRRDADPVEVGDSFD